ncbi:trafficking protein particle complex subunit 10 isoform X5 [Homo sapiens]|uniref:trafficking protein particle complex subunit 10 isoform X5 n=1 Tax=Homo sapiens TaxID=9606 RepID=UPI0007DC53C9|nr:trafficking protein particle complex subunit 10 isoform X5 [Homo sapiens]XP_054180788.1 trafficking protein particle complex subunit 10 isoform X5 [Homo sapiens]|eukprot:XP_016883943.1 trafficking protein particle complex subunit 10 isoform X5 [Homo sapiens]
MDASEEPLPPVIYTMENKPIVTCAGDQNLFTSVYPTLSQQLPREPMEWRRSYGRAPKMIHLESNFVQFKEELLPKEGNKALLTFPFLHIYWTECCDTEVYKATVKDDLTKWQNVLKAHSSVDWLIVIVENDAKKKNKTNILPRTSIVDKIRNDFCNKQSDRCVVLSDPLKDSSRTQESWNAFLTKLRTLLLMSFTKNLGKFEDDMRTLREKRTEPGWSFCEYFMVQEELAFVFEMLQQFEDALVQYDELDALFSQYVVNFGAGDGANWLTFFCQPVKSWNGLILRKPIDMEKRESIQRREATLLDLRSYLFSRQCTLLLFLQRPWEVAQRALELLHNCVQELKLLELKSLGYLCGLVSEKGPNSEDLNRTVDLLAGLGAERPETANTAQSPYKKLKEALSSVEAFEKHYLDLSHATIEMYTSIGRIRSAKFVGKDLAEFYMRKKAPQKAEIYLQGALKNYLAEGWALPITHTRKQLAECQKHLGQIENYLQTSSLLASDHHLTEEERKHFCQEILDFASQPSDSPGHKIVLPMHSFAQLRDLHFDPSNAVVHVGGVLCVEITMYSQMPVPVHVEQIVVNVHFSIEKNSYRKTAEWLTKHKTSNGIINFPPETAPFPVSQNSLPALELYEMFERSPSDNSLNTTGIICRNVHMLLRRQESSSSLEMPSGVALEEGAHVLRCSHVTLEPGANQITFRTQAKEPGTYTLRQLCASVGSVWFVLPHIYPIVQYDVYSQEPQLHVEPLADSLLAGIPQRVKFTVTTGHYTIKNGDSLQLSNAEAMLILCQAESRAVVYSNTREQSSEAALRIQSSDKVTSISLPVAPAYHVIEFELEVLSLPSAPALGGESDMLGMAEPHRKHKDKQRTGRCMVTTDHKVSIDCPWSIYSTVIALTFSVPFRTTHSLLSSGTRKYVQVCVQNLSELDFQLSDSYLVDTGDSTDLQLVPLNTQSQQPIYSKQSVFFVWELKWTEEPPPSLHCRFSVGFSPASEEQLSISLKPYTYEFKVENFFTLYNVKAEIFPPSGMEYCRTGSLCSLEVLITRLSDLLEVDKDEALTESDEHFSTKLMYEVVDNSSNWAVCGKSCGVISMPVAARATHRVHMEVMPLFAGYLPLPDVRLFKYLPHHSAHSSQLDADSWIENDSLSVDKHGDDQPDSSSLKSRGSVHSACSSEHKGLPMPRLQALPAGQVFNSSSGTQVLVIPSQDDHVLEVSVT